MPITIASCKQAPTARHLPRLRRFCRQPLGRTWRGRGRAPAAAPPCSSSCGAPAGAPGPARPALRRSPALTRQGPRAARFCPAKRTRSRLPERGHGWGPARPAHAPAGSSAAGTCCPHPPWRQRRPDTARAAPPPEAAPEVPSQGAPPANKRLLIPVGTALAQVVVMRLFSCEALWES